MYKIFYKPMWCKSSHARLRVLWEQSRVGANPIIGTQNEVDSNVSGPYIMPVGSLPT